MKRLCIENFLPQGHHCHVAVKLVPQAKERLREVQEVLAEREFRIGRFYVLRQSWVAAIARLQSLVDSYPLYSGADEALYLLGNAYEQQVEQIRAARWNEAVKGKLIQEFTDKAAAAYSRILTRYPVTDRAGDAKKRLESLHRPVPTPTPEAIAQNKQEEASRKEVGRFGKMMLNMHRKPDTSVAARVGEPTLVDPKPTSAPELAKQNAAAVVAAATVVAAASHREGTGTVSVETVKPGEAPPPNQPVPRSDAQPGAAAPEEPSDVPELKPNVAPDAGAAATSPTTSTPPAQINEIDRRRLVREQHRIVPGQHDHRGAETQRPRARADPGEQVQRRGNLSEPGEVMLDDEGALIAESLGLDDVLDVVLEAGGAVDVGATALCLRGAKESKLHGPAPCPHRGFFAVSTTT